MKLIITAEIEPDSLDEFNYSTLNQIANTVRRTAHAIEGSRPPQSAEGGAVLDFAGKIIGTWSIEE